MKVLLSVDLIFEALTAIALLAVPGIAVALIFSPELPPALSVFARIAGLGLGLFVIGCWMAWRRGKQNAVQNVLFCYNFFALVLLVVFGIFYDPVGPLLWPAAGIHMALAVALVLVAKR